MSIQDKIILCLFVPAAVFGACAAIEYFYNRYTE